METKSNHIPQFPNRNTILNPLLHNTSGRINQDHKSAMEKFKQAVIRFADSNPSLFGEYGSNAYQRLIEQRFSQFFLDFQTPNHPPYAAMIHRAIWELNEKGGSSEDSISNYIKREYKDLPWAHSTLLKHHLEKLCDHQEILLTCKQRYLLSGEDSDPISIKKSSKHYKKRKKLKRKHQNKCKKEEEPDKQIIEVFQEQENFTLNELHEPQYLMIENEKYEQENTLIDVFVQEVREDTNTHLDSNENENETDINEKKKGKLKRERDSKSKRSSKRVKKQDNEEVSRLGKRVSTRSQLKIILKKDGLNRTNGQRSKLRSWKKSRSPSLERPLKELLNPLSIIDSELGDSNVIDMPKRKYKRRGRRPKAKKVEKNEVLLISKSADNRNEGQKSWIRKSINGSTNGLEKRGRGRPRTSK